MIRTYGSVDGGLELMRVAWTKLQQVFTVRHQQLILEGVDEHPGTTIYIGAHRERALLSDHPVDLLVVERGHIREHPKKYQPSKWGGMVAKTPVMKRPVLVIEMWLPHAQLWTCGPMSKHDTATWQKMGFESRCQVVRATEVGGAINQARLIVIRSNHTTSFTWTWGSRERSSQIKRPMENLLRPPGLVPKTKYLPQMTPRGSIPRSQEAPMPCRRGGLIQTEKGIRRLFDDELIRGLGAPKEWKVSGINEGTINRTTSLFLWEYLSSSLTETAHHQWHHQPGEVSSKQYHPTLAEEDLEAWEEDPRSEPVRWRPPDLSEEGAWYKDRVRNLRRAVKGLPGEQEEYKKGLEDLERHRNNYDEQGPRPTTLQLLWWEFPPEHWKEIREGAPMNFLSTPPEMIHENASMTAGGLQSAIEFTEELIALGVLRLGNEVVKTTAPLFVVDKPGQEGQYRVIADMLRGGQNSYIGADPTILPRITHIADQLYTGGYSSVIDASKYFYQFRTSPEDQPYLGVKHPLTGDLYYYHGLPMGSSQSPASACRKGYGFLRKLRQRHAMFKGDPKPNCWWTGFSGLGYDPSLGYGLAFMDQEGKPCVKVWAFVDDFLIHGPTKERVEEALSHFLDTALEVGMLCHPKKLVPPGQVVRYCGFILDTRKQPIMRIPRSKRERALAIVELLLAESTRIWSRLALSVAAGVLESLVEGTPRRIGRTYLRYTHSTVRPPDSGTGLEAYLGTTTIPPEMTRELEWWGVYLREGAGRYVRATSAATFIPTWGDGSGTGTGGTYGCPNGANQEAPMKMWKGKWSPFVHHFSSNWKELHTLLTTMTNLQTDDDVDTQGTTVFYFTDNSTTYWISASSTSPSPGLHQLIEAIRRKEIALGCHLEVIHVPGLVMVQQGTDALSRGIWMSALHSNADTSAITTAVFEPFPFDGVLVQEYVNMLPLRYHPTRKWVRGWWDQRWNAQHVFHRLSVWHPPPEIARQVINFVLECWAECPLTTSALFFIPRTVPSFWRGFCKAFIELPTIFPHEQPLRVPPRLNIPCIVLYLPPHTRSLPSHNRLDRPPYPTQGRWHRNEAAYLRGLPPRNLEPRENIGVCVSTTGIHSPK